MRMILVHLLVVIATVWAAPVEDFVVPSTGTTPGRGDIGDSTHNLGGEGVGQGVPVNQGVPVGVDNPITVNKQRPLQPQQQQQQQPIYANQKYPGQGYIGSGSGIGSGVGQGVPVNQGVPVGVDNPITVNRQRPLQQQQQQQQQQQPIYANQKYPGQGYIGSGSGIGSGVGSAPQMQQQQQFPYQGEVQGFNPQTQDYLQRQQTFPQGVAQTTPGDTTGTGYLPHDQVSGTGVGLPEKPILPQQQQQQLQTTPKIPQIPQILPLTILPVFLPPILPYGGGGFDRQQQQQRQLPYGQFSGNTGFSGYPFTQPQQFLSIPYSGNWQFPWWLQGFGQQFGIGSVNSEQPLSSGANSLGTDEGSLFGPVGGTRLGHSRYPAGYWSMLNGRRSGTNLMPKTGTDFGQGYTGYGTGIGTGTGFSGSGYGLGFPYGSGYPYSGTSGNYLGAQQNYPGYDRVRV